MIETSGTLDLSDEESCPDRGDDDEQGGRRVAFLGLGHQFVAPGPRSASHITLQDIADMAPKDDQNANSLLDPEYKDVKVGFEELCPVCGDKVSGYHYGLLTCESCKGFFKRTVQNKKVYSCVDNRNCQIDKSQRKRCPFCRFQKCLSVGMKLEAVRSDRMRGGRNKFGPMYKRDRALKQQAARQVQIMHDTCSDINILTNGMMVGRIPESPEDVKPDPLMLQASLNLYSGSMSASTTSNIISGLVPGLNCLSVTAAAPLSSASSSAGVAVNPGGASPPPPTHPHHVLLASHHAQHQGLVPISTSAPCFTQQGFGHISTQAMLQPHSPKGHYPHHRHPQQPHHPSNGPREHGGSSPPQHHHQLPIHTQSISDFHMAQSQLGGHVPGNSSGSLGSATPDSEKSFPLSPQVNPKVQEALRAFQGPRGMIQLEQSVLSPLIAEFKSTMVDESEVKHKMLTFMQSELSHTDVSSSPERFLSVLCRMVDQLLFLMVEWARSSSFFKEIKVEDQMKLLHNSWSEILILDFIYRQIHNVWDKEILMPNGDLISFEILDNLGLGDVKAKVFELIKKGRELKMDFNEYMCLKFLIMLNPDVSSLENRAYIEQSQEKVNAALFEYCLLVYPDMSDKFSQLLMRLPEIRLISIRTEDFLYFKHLSNEVPDQTLLTEMLHAKRRG